MTEAGIRIILVRPKENKNIGAVCRAMKTMGLDSLYIVGGEKIDRAEAAITAVHAVDVLDRAVLCTTVEEAVGDSVLVAGITRRRGRWRKYFAITPDQLTERIARVEAGTCSLVFGNEAAGLNAADLSRCHLSVRIPSSSRFPSLNLSHAVQIIGYELFRLRGGSRRTKKYLPISGGELEKLVSLMLASLTAIGFFSQGDPGEMGVFLRDIFARAMLEQREAERLARIFRKISGLIARRPIDP